MLASFDIETTETLDQITCAALAFEDGTYRTFYNKASPTEPMHPLQVAEMVEELCKLQELNYTLVTWTGLSFDWKVIYNLCAGTQRSVVADLALSHCDLMFCIFCKKGWRVSLNNTLKGMGLSEKVKQLTLRDGTIIDGVTGIMAPMLWETGEHLAVLEYLKGDVRGTLELAQKVQTNSSIKWLSTKGKLNFLKLPELASCRDCLTWDEPDNSWMDVPITRESFYEWIGQSVAGQVMEEEVPF